MSVAPVASPVEEGEDAQFRVMRTEATTGALTVRYSVSESGKMVASDEEGDKTVDFAHRESEKTVTVPTVEDTVPEADSTVTLTLTAFPTYNLGAATADVVVEDDDAAPSVTVASDGDVTEGSAAVFTLTRTGDTAQTLDVAYEVAATGDFGVTTGAGTATFPANSATVQVSVATTGDGTHEAHGSVTLTLTADTGADPAYLLGAPSTATAAVEDDDDSPATGTVTITGTAAEGQTLTADTSGLTDADGLANAAYDYQWVRVSGGSEADISGATSQTYVPVFADVGATLKVKVTVTDDEGHEAEFTSAPTTAVTARPRPEVTVASDGDVTEGSAAVFTLTRTGDTAGTLDVTYEVTATGDFGVTTGADTATFPANSATVQVSVDTTGDTTHEAHGSVTLTLTADTGADPAYLLGDPSTATAAVRDDDDSPATGTVTITGTAREGETLTADTSGISDADGLDNAAYVYQWVRTPSGGSEADISGATSQTYVPVFADVGATLKVKVTVTDDEGHEAEFTSAPTSAVAARPRPEVTGASDGDVTEGSPAVFTLTRTGDTAGALDVAYEVAATGDFGVTTGAGTATFLANNDTVQVSVPTTDDGAHEAHGSVTLTLTEDTSTDPAYLLGDPATATAAVRDDDDSPATGTVTITGTPTEGETLTADTSGLTDADGLANADYDYQWVRVSGGSEADISGATSQTYVPVFADVGATLKVKVTVTDDEGHEAEFTSAPTSAVAARPRPEVTGASDGDVTEGSPAVFTLTRTGDTAGALDVAYEVAATGDFGVTTGAGTATFLANNDTVQVSVPTTGDGTHEAHGSVTLTLTEDTSADPAYLLGAPSTATAAVRDDDDSPATGTVTITGTPTEGETLTADTSGITDADGLDNAVWAYQWVRTPSGGGDADISGATSKTYVPVFADTGATLKVQVTVTDDEDHQATFTSAPTTAVAALPRPSVTVASDGDVTEGDTVTFTLTRTGDTAQTLDVAYETTASGDFGVTSLSGTATFLANSSTVQVTVPTTDDTTHEAHGSVTLTLTANPVAYDLGDEDAATATVLDNDDSPATGAVTITGTPTEGETLTADTSGITDADGLDSAVWVYQWVRTPPGGSDADISGATSKTYVPVFADTGATLKVRVTVTDDEGHQTTFTSAPTSAVAALPRPEVTVASDGDVTEGDTVTFTLTRTGDTAQTLDVAYEVTASGSFGAATGADTATFLANSATVQVSVDTTDDSTHEAHGSVTLTLTANPVAYDLGTEDAATAAVRDNDDSPATGSVTVTGTPTEGETLTADTSGITDADGLDNAVWVYQWVRTPPGGSDADISGATLKTYVPVFADAGATLKVRVTVTDDEGHQATFTSASTTAVTTLPRPEVTVASDSDVTEGDTAVFTLTRTGDTAGTLDVAYETTASGDFGVTTGADTATFLANSSTTQVSVDTTDDSTHEAHGSVTLTLTANPAAYDLGTEDTATAAIQDDDDSPATGSVTITGTAREGETLTADTSGITDADGLDNAVWVYQWVRTPSGGNDADISGATGATYVPVFADAGATLKVRVTVTDDEGHQATFTSAPTTAVTALPRPEVTVASDGDVTEGDTVTFTLTRTGDTAQTLDVDYETTASGDFGVTTGAGTATFLANSSTVQVSVDTTDDSTHEAHGSVTLTLTANPAAYDLGTEDTATAAIQDDDDSPATGSVTITGTAREGETLTVDTSGITDADGLDNAAWAYQWVQTPSGGNDADISGATGATYVPVFADAGATLKVRVTVTDDEGHRATITSAPTSVVEAALRPTVAVERVASPVEEGEDAQFRVTRTGVTAGALTVRYSVSETGAMVASDEEGAQTVDFGDGDTERMVTVPTEEDTDHEADSTVTLTLTADAAYDLGTATAELTVEDDDNAAPTGAVTIDDTTPVVGETLTADASSLDDPDGLTSRSFTWQWLRVSGGTQTPIAGATTASYTVVATDVGATLKVRVGFTDDDGTEESVESAETATVEAAPVPTVSVTPVASPVEEGVGAQFRVTRTGVTAGALTVRYGVSETGDMVAPGEEGAQTIDFAEGGTEQTVTVPTAEDTVHEADSTVTLTLTADAAYILGAQPSAEVTVEDDDNAAPTGAVTIDDTTPVVGETLTADASSLDDPDGLTSRSFTWQWLRVSGGTETEIAGATTASYTVADADVGATLKVRVGFTDDDETAETVESAETAVVAPLPPEVTVASDGDVTEGSPAVFTLTRTGDTAQTLGVAYEVAATGSFGVTTGTGTATFPANSSTVQVSVATTGDSIHEAHGSVTVTLTADTSADPAYLLGDPSAATAAVEDDDLIEGRQRKLEYALAWFGRTVVQDLVTAVEDRPGSAAGTTATLAGMPLVSFRSEEDMYGALRRYVGPDGELSGTAAWRELLSRSSFQLSLGEGGEGEADGSGAGALVLWSRGSRSWSEGRLDPAVATQGEVLSGQLGLELRAREDTLLGVMLSGSAGEVEFDGELGTKVETELVGVHPYAQWSPRQGLRTWAMLGYGAGEATLTDGFSTRTGADVETDIEMRMAAGGGSNEVASLWGIDWSVGTSGFIVQLDADEVRFDADGQAALLPAVKSGVWQVRLLLEGSAGEDFGGVSGLSGNVELAARVDGGDAESGVGMELGGGVGYGRADLGLEVEASGRVLLSHEEEGLEDAGVSLGLELDPGAPGRGVYFALTPSWGNAASGARAVWEGRQASTGGPHGPDGRDRFDPQMRLSSELGYTTPVPIRRGTLTTYGAFSSDGGAAWQYRIGRRLELAGIASMSLEAERRESAGAAPEHGIWLRGSIRY